MANDLSSSPPSQKPRRRKLSSQEMQQHLLEQATTLFERSGFGTPVAVLFAQAKITPPTLYRVVGDKDDLIVAVVKKWDEDWLAWMDSVLDRPGTPHDRLLGLFTKLERWLKQHDWRGSLADNAAATLPADHPVNVVIAEHRKAVRNRLRAVAAETGTADPDDVARRLHVLLDGAMAGARMEHGPGPVRAARSAIDSALSTHDPE